MRSPRALQVLFLVLLAVAFGQVGWWVADLAFYTEDVRGRTQALYEEDARAAAALLRAGRSRSDVESLFPHVTVVDGRAAVRPEAVAALDDARWHRLNRYGWEGVFFLGVLAAGMVVLYRTLRRDAALRRRQQNFVAAVSHELKSPLASLKLALDTIALRNPEGEARERIRDRMRADVARLEGMITNLLDSARIQEGRVALAPERVPVREAVEQTLVAFREAAEASGVTITSDVPADLAVAVDPTAFRSVVRNLIENAVKATAAKGGGRVAVRAQAAGRQVTLAVTDDGIGIPPGEERRIFEKFYRPGDELTRRNRGSGLGLYIVRRLVELSRGQVTAESPGPGRGATFTVRWPAAREGVS